MGFSKTLFLFAVPGMAWAEPSVLETVNVEVNRSHQYSHCAQADFRELAPGEPGNCAALAYTKKAELERRGVSSAVMFCKLKTGEVHAFLFTTEGVLDNRFDDIVDYVAIGCVI